MQDIPFFNTGNGIASLRLKEIPFFQTAYITVQSAVDEEKLLQECIGLCRAAGADRIYATGLSQAVKHSGQIDVIRMSRSADIQIENDAMLFPIQEETLQLWRDIYNKKMRSVTGAAYMNNAMAKEILAGRSAYFIHRNGELIGIGSATGNEISVVASIQQGAGKAVVQALLGALSAETAFIEVASDNTKAMGLYTSLEFVATGVVRSWYKII